MVRSTPAPPVAPLRATARLTGRSNAASKEAVDGAHWGYGRPLQPVLALRNLNGSC